MAATATAVTLTDTHTETPSAPPKKAVLPRTKMLMSLTSLETLPMCCLRAELQTGPRLRSLQQAAPEPAMMSKSPILATAVKSQSPAVPVPELTRSKTCLSTLHLSVVPSSRLADSKTSNLAKTPKNPPPRTTLPMRPLSSRFSIRMEPTATVAQTAQGRVQRRWSRSFSWRSQHAWCLPPCHG
jgi:hypothetical protein